MACCPSGRLRCCCRRRQHPEAGLAGVAIEEARGGVDVGELDGGVSSHEYEADAEEPAGRLMLDHHGSPLRRTKASHDPTDDHGRDGTQVLPLTTGEIRTFTRR